jgi:SAM-dependent methyltransferase
LHSDFGLCKSFFQKKSVLEVGANVYSPVHSLTDASRAVGIDPLTKYYCFGYPESAMQIQGRGEDLPFAEKSFDIAICLNVLDHTEKPEKVLKQINRCLKENGTLLLAIDTFSLSKWMRAKTRLVSSGIRRW